ncbi:MmgE/PrpD family protein [Loktanella sp. Alg231-35]|uniref:MmgE/PrpD family protein n=1 Tax=Loktanella sp. Alg231-35 TaxID=1922220 RepID=UPI00131F2C65|nr:MmgE/PrpD family protein [Loktanella sp. Alg231-35]
MTLARRFAHWSGSLCLEDVPDGVRICARRAALDTLGVAVAGAVHSKVRLLGQSIAKIPGNCFAATGQRTDAIAAATINGMAAHLWDYDDNSYTGMIHGSAIILPAVLAVAQETGASDDDALLAFIIGSEVAYCLGEICTHSHFMQGWWATGSCALIGAVAGISRLYALDAEETANALGMAAVNAGIQRAIAGTDTKPYLCGNVAAQAITLTRAAQAGLTGPQDAFEQENGFFALLNRAILLSEHAETLGVRWRLETPGLLFKTSPVCSAVHAIIEETAKLLEEGGKTADDIETAVAEVPELVRASLVFGVPESAQQAQFSLPYCFACAALHGSVRLQDLSLAELNNRKKQDLMQRVTTRNADDLSTPPESVDFPESVRLTITFKDGQTITGFCGEAFGMPNRPLANHDLQNKFNDCLAFAGKTQIAPDLNEFSLVGLADQIFFSLGSNHKNSTQQGDPNETAEQT